MSKKANQTSAALITILASSKDDGRSLYDNVYRAIRKAILERHLPPGSRLPSTRVLAGDLNVSRNTVESAYAQLEAEGFTRPHVGSGTYVRDVVVQRSGSVQKTAVGRRPMNPQETLSQRGKLIWSTGGCPEPLQVRAFSAGMPALEDFPTEIWQRLCSRRLRSMKGPMLGYGNPQGADQLRSVIAQYLATARGVRCIPEQILILPSSQQGLDLCVRLLADPREMVWLEDPGYLGARNAFLASGATVVPVPVDDEGLQVSVGTKKAPKARLAYVTPSHQYPTGVTLSLNRRIALLDWAEATKAWVIEDDYDSEFHYAGRPVAAIQGLAASDRVIYVGTFSKVMFPNLRIAYMVVPPALIDSFVTGRSLLDGHSPTFFQSVLADFMEGGHFAVHLRRMRLLYRARRDFLLDIARERLSNWLEFGALDGGLQVPAYCKIPINDERFSKRASSVGLELPPISKLYLTEPAKPGWIVGFSALTPTQISSGMDRLSELLDTL
ncbi:MAG: PLP-dependent aminotransferase family protein [Verrucomicrobia bacterium]|nr:PLP-dependent aminotransferase family protein [Verrucomicrobiota bacterium]